MCLCRSTCDDAPASESRRRTMRWGRWALATLFVLAPAVSVGSCSDPADPVASFGEAHLASPLVPILETYYPVTLE